MKERSKIMKKRQLYSVLLVGLFILSGCGKKPNPTQTDYFSGPVLINNAEEVIVQDINYTMMPDPLEVDYSIPSDIKIINSNYQSSGLLVVKNAFNAVGFYSLTFGRYLIEPMYNEAWVNYRIQTLYRTGYILQVDYEKKTLLIDGFSNVLYDADQISYVNYSTMTIDFNEEVKKNFYLTILLDDDEIYFEYDETFVATKIDALPTYSPPAPIGEVFLAPNLEPLEEFGLKGYHISINEVSGLVIVYDQVGKVVSKFMFPDWMVRKIGPVSGTRPFLIGKNFYYQRISVLDPEAEAYDFLDGSSGVKANLVTYRIPLLTGITEEVSFPHIISGVDLLLDADKYLKLAVLEVTSINAEKETDRYFEYIVDEALNIKQDVTNQDVFSFVKVGDHYFNYSTEVLYDKDMKFIVDLSAMDPKLLENGKYFIGKIGYFYGLVDINGKVVLPFEFDYLFEGMTENYIVGVKKGVAYSVNVNDRSEEKIGELYDAVAPGIFYVINYETKILRIINAKETMYNYDFKIDGTINVSSGNIWLNDGKSHYVFISINETNGHSVRTDLTFAFNPISDNDFNTWGSEVTKRWASGSSIVDPFIGKLGVIQVHHQPVSATIYVKYLVPATGTYAANVFHNGSIAFYFYDELNDIMVELARGVNTITYDFVNGEVFYLSISNAAETYYPINVNIVT